MVPGAPAEMSLFMFLYDITLTRGQQSYLGMMRFNGEADFSGQRFVGEGPALSTVSSADRTPFDFIFVSSTRVILLMENVPQSNIVFGDANLTVTRDSDGTPTSYALPTAMGPVAPIPNVGSALRAVVVDHVMESIVSNPSTNQTTSTTSVAAEFFIIATTSTPTRTTTRTTTTAPTKLP